MESANKYTEKEKAFLINLKEKIVKRHSTCKGTGYTDSEMTLCECMKVFKYLKSLYYSHIPSDYWDLTFDELHVSTSYKKIVHEYIENLDNAIQKGLGIMFLGERGIGKTSLVAEIAKAAVIKRYSVYYEIMQVIVDDRFTDSQTVTRKIKNADLVIIDELDKVLMRENSNIPKQIENMLRDILPNGKSVLICSNLNEDEVESKFNIMSLIKRYINIVHMEGEDYSEVKQKTWTDRLRNKEDHYFTKNIRVAAEEYYQNEKKSNEKEFDGIASDIVG